MIKLCYIASFPHADLIEHVEILISNGGGKNQRNWNKMWYLKVDPCTCNLVLTTSKGVVRYALKPVHYHTNINGCSGKTDHQVQL